MPNTAPYRFAAEQIAAMRSARGLSVRGLARAASVDVKTAKKYLTGKPVSTISAIKLLLVDGSLDVASASASDADAKKKERND